MIEVPKYKVFLRSGEDLKSCTVDALDLPTAMIEAEEKHGMQAMSAEVLKAGDLKAVVSDPKAEAKK